MVARFLDASILLSAYIKPLREPPEDVAEQKARSRAIVSRIQGGEPVMTTIIHVAEMANILEARAPLRVARGIIQGLLGKENIEVVPVTGLEYSDAIDSGERFNVGINDALAYNVMTGRGVSEAYSLDKHFDGLPKITRIQE